MNAFLTTTSAVADVFTIAASGIALYVFWTKRGAIASAIRILLNYSSQLALNDLRVKLEHLNDLTVDDPAQKVEVVNILNDILGQMRGNKALCRHCSGLLPSLTSLAENPGKRLTEPRKRALVSELRELIRHVAVEDYRDLMGNTK